MKKSAPKTKKGFTLVEMLVSVALFAMIIIAMSQMFGSFVTNYQASRDIQKNLEDAQQSIDTMAKIIRSSTLVSPTSTGATPSIRFFESSQTGGNSCIVYWFDNSNVLRTNSAPATDATSCASASISTGLGSGSNVINTTTTGNFYVGGGAVKTVTISANLQQGTTVRTVPIQSTVSLRD